MIEPIVHIPTEQDVINIQDTLEIECLVQSLLDAMAHYDNECKLREEYDGYSYDYFHRHEIEQKESAMAEFGNRLSAYIDKKVDEKLKELKV